MWRLSVDAKAPPEDRDISGFVCSATATCFLCGAAGALALVVAQRLLG